MLLRLRSARLSFLNHSLGGTVTLPTGHAWEKFGRPVAKYPKMRRRRQLETGTSQGEI